MSFPCLILEQTCTTPIIVEIEQEGLNKYGEPLETVKWEGKCNYQDEVETMWTLEKKIVKLTGICYIRGDIASNLPTLSGGKVIVHGVERRIAQGIRARNIDGTVNFVELRLE